LYLKEADRCNAWHLKAWSTNPHRYHQWHWLLCFKRRRVHIQRKNTKKLIKICQCLLLLGTIDTFARKSDPTWSYTLADTKANKGFDNRSNHHAFMMRMTRHRKLSLFRWYFWFEYFSIIFKITCGMVFVFSNWQITWRCSFQRHIAIFLLFLSISCFEVDVHTVALYVMFIHLWLLISFVGFL